LYLELFDLPEARAPWAFCGFVAFLESFHDTSRQVASVHEALGRACCSLWVAIRCSIEYVDAPAPAARTPAMTRPRRVKSDRRITEKDRQ